MQNRKETEMSSEELAREAYKLINYAKSKLAIGNITSAEKCLLRAERLYPTHQAKKLLSQIRNGTATAKSSARNATCTQGTQQTDENTDLSTSNVQEPVQRRRTSSHRSLELDYTKEQLEAVRRVFKCQHQYYEILIVMPDASADDIKDAYKKLALLLHPDKNKAPGANEAFQILGTAKDVLSDPLKRQKYNMKLQEMWQSQNVACMSTTSGFDIPMWLIVGGVTIFAAGMFATWWNKRQKASREQSRNEDEMSQDN